MPRDARQRRMVEKAGSQIFKLNIVMTAITILAIVSSVMYLAISRLEAVVMRRR